MNPFVLVLPVGAPPLVEELVRMNVGGVDTLADFHVAAMIDSNVGILGIESFPADEAEYGPCWDGSRLMVKSTRVGAEGTGSWGVGLARFFHAHIGGVLVREDYPFRREIRA